MEPNRRRLLQGTVGAPFLTVPARAALNAPPKKYPFTLGVASGDPAPDGFVIWTRLAPAPLSEHGGMPLMAVTVGYEIAEDDSFRRIVQTGKSLARPELAHAVHVEVGGLRPSRRYWYRFFAADATSIIGTARTAPSVDTTLDQVRIGVAGCQHYENGLYTAYRYLAAEPDIDAIYHYGDYIYERSSKARPKVRQHVISEPYSLDDYRRHYAQYKMDPDLQAAHASVAFLMTFDDHEVSNNWAGDEDENGTPLEIFLLRRAAAFQAWYEHLPVRRTQFPTSGGIQMFRRIDYGRLLRIHLLDTRQYRSGQSRSQNAGQISNPDINTAPETMLGAVQEAWLSEGLERERDWHMVAQQVMIMPMLYPETRRKGRTNLDSWSGYPKARARLTRMLHERGLSNVVISTGDAHVHHAGNVHLHADDSSGAVVASEFVCTSISSGGDGFGPGPGWAKMERDNPHCKLFDARRGYQLFDITPRRWETSVKVVDKVSAPGGVLSTTARFVVDPKKPGL